VEKLKSCNIPVTGISEGGKREIFEKKYLK
jgi:hypothetical protein